MTRVGDVRCKVRERELLRFNEVVEVFGAVVPHGGEIVTPEDPEHLEGRHSLAARREFPQRVLPEVGRYRAYPARFVGREVLSDQEPTELGEPVDQRPSEVARIEGRRSTLRDQAEALSDLGITEPLTRSRSPRSVHEVGSDGAFVTPQLVHRRVPLARDDWGYREALFGDSDRRGEHVLQRHRAVALHQGAPTRDGAGYSDRARTRLRNIVVTRGLDRFARHPGAGPPARVEADQAAPRQRTTGSRIRRRRCRSGGARPRSARPPRRPPRPLRCLRAP